jgi:DNA primase
LFRDLGIDNQVLEELGNQSLSHTTTLSPRSLVEFNFPRLGERGTLSESKAVSYLKSRGLTEDDFRRYDVRFTTSGRYAGRVIFPIYESKKLVCFVARAVFPWIQPKYLYPRRGETILTAGEAIFGYDGYSTRKVVLVEGVFDALSVQRYLGFECFSVMAVLGKSLSAYQLAKLWRLPTTAFYVMLDSDARDEGIMLAAKLLTMRRTDKVEVRMCSISAKDPAESSRDEIIKSVETSELVQDTLSIGTMLLRKSGVRQRPN